jgi:hypothetical protein
MPQFDMGQALVTMYVEFNMLAQWQLASNSVTDEAAPLSFDNATTRELGKLKQKVTAIN